MSGREDVRLKQEVTGDGNQVAGNNIINEGDGFRPNPDNPNLMECSQCEYPGVSRTAIECPKCGHSFLAERLALAEKAREESRVFWTIAGTALIVAISGSWHIGSRTGLGFWESLGVMVIALGGLWYGWAWLSVHWELWKARRKRRDDY